MDCPEVDISGQMNLSNETHLYPQLWEEEISEEEPSVDERGWLWVVVFVLVALTII